MADPLFNLANLEAAAGRTEDAIRLYRAALSRDADHAGSLMNLAALLGRAQHAGQNSSGRPQ